ncbi:MAG: hypothetical protein GTN73_05225 [Candidatus Aminicenantes bacterium]|nr:hypothetical protein [Candidatus Aminicenantes bacterium]
MAEIMVSIEWHRKRLKEVRKEERKHGEWKKNVATILFSIMFLLLATIAGAFCHLNGWQEGAIHGIALGVIAPMGRLIFVITNEVDKRLHLMESAGWGCIGGGLAFFAALVMMGLGPVFGVSLIYFVVRGGTPEVALVGFMLGISGGIGVFEMGKSSYALRVHR